MITHKGTVRLHTERLRIRRFVMSDSITMYKNYAADERVARFLSWEAYKNADDIQAFLSAQIDSYKHLNKYHWAIDFNSEIIGSISVISLDERNHSCEMGYCLGYDFWNMGITSEALRAVIGFLFNEVNVHRVMAKHAVDNPASGKVMLKCNMTYEGRLREHYYQDNGTYSDSLVYGILRSEF